jgi:hypothetical protein
VEGPTYRLQADDGGVSKETVEQAIDREIDAWPSRLEVTLFGSGGAVVIAEQLRSYCRLHLGVALTSVLFYRRGVGAVFGLGMNDGSKVVVKVHRRDLVGESVDAFTRVQRHLADGGLPAPRPIGKPAALGNGIATAEEFVDRGVIGNAHEAGVRMGLAAALHTFVMASAPLLPSPGLPLASPFGLSSDRLWPTPHDLRFDFTLPGGEWIDRAAATARNRLGLTPAAAVIGHADWRVENLRVQGDDVVAIFDWDSVVLCPEPALVGHTAASFTADWANGDIDPLPTLDESRAFVADYETVHGSAFTAAERESIDAAHLYALAYGARCEHSDATIGLFPDEGLDHGWRGLLRARGKRWLGADR